MPATEEIGSPGTVPGLPGPLRLSGTGLQNLSRGLTQGRRQRLPTPGPREHNGGLGRRYVRPVGAEPTTRDQLHQAPRAPGEAPSWSYIWPPRTRKCANTTDRTNHQFGGARSGATYAGWSPKKTELIHRLGSVRSVQDISWGA